VLTREIFRVDAQQRNSAPGCFASVASIASLRYSLTSSGGSVARLLTAPCGREWGVNMHWGFDCYVVARYVVSYPTPSTCERSWASAVCELHGIAGYAHYGPIRVVPLGVPAKCVSRARCTIPKLTWVLYLQSGGAVHPLRGSAVYVTDCQIRLAPTRGGRQLRMVRISNVSPGEMQLH